MSATLIFITKLNASSSFDGALYAEVVELADTLDLKSSVFMACGFESRPRYQKFCEVDMELSTIYIIMAIVAIISLYFGRKIALQSIEESLMRKAFKEAKQEYLKYFHDNFDNRANDAYGAVIEKQKEEITRLIKENDELRARLQKKNEPGANR